MASKSLEPSVPETIQLVVDAQGSAEGEEGVLVSIGAAWDVVEKASNRASATVIVREGTYEEELPALPSPAADSKNECAACEARVQLGARSITLAGEGAVKLSLGPPCRACRRGDYSWTTVQQCFASCGGTLVLRNLVVASALKLSGEGARWRLERCELRAGLHVSGGTALELSHCYLDGEMLDVEGVATFALEACRLSRTDIRVAAGVRTEVAGCLFERRGCLRLELPSSGRLAGNLFDCEVYPVLSRKGKEARWERVRGACPPPGHVVEGNLGLDHETLVPLSDASLAIPAAGPDSELLEPALEGYGQLLDACLGLPAPPGLPEPDVTFTFAAEEAPGGEKRRRVEPRTPVRAHSFVLRAQSEHFRALFASGMAEAASRSVEVRGFSPETLRAVLRYLYTGQIAAGAHSTAELLELHRAGDYYALPALARRAALRVDLAPEQHEEALACLRAAEATGSAELRRGALEHVRARGRGVVLSEAYGALAGAAAAGDRAAPALLLRPPRGRSRERSMSRPPSNYSYPPSP
eukprot:tig00000849_g4743.t1